MAVAHQANAMAQLELLAGARGTRDSSRTATCCATPCGVDFPRVGTRSPGPAIGYFQRKPGGGRDCHFWAAQQTLSTPG